jgi:hypothetical protein
MGLKIVGGVFILAGYVEAVECCVLRVEGRLCFRCY